MDSVNFFVLLGVLALSSQVFALTSPGNNTEGRFPILMPNVHPYKVS